MKKKRNFIFATVMIFTILFGIKVKATNIQLNDTIYFLDTKDWGDIYMYIFNSQTNTAAWSWQNEEGKMTDTGIDINNHNLYAYTLTNSYYQDYHNTIVFSSKNAGKQTKDLSYIRNNILFAPSIQVTDSSKFDGEWYIKDKSQLKTLITNANNKIEEQYTASSYQALKNILNSKVYSYSSSGYTNDRNYKESFTGVKDIANTDLVLVTLDGYSVYDDAVTDLNTAINNLVLKNKIITSAGIGGSINIASKFFEDNETINFNVNPLLGYETKQIVITKINGYDNDNNPILSTNDEDITIINPNDTNSYSYTAKDNDIYINVTFKKKTFSITTIIGSNGVIDPNGPITVEYGENKEFTITANKGYNIKKVSVNGIDYELNNGVLQLNNITEDTEITVYFQLNNYKVTIDDKEYLLSYGSKITDLENYEDIVNKDGYIFKGFIIKESNDNFNIDTEIENDISLITVFEKKVTDNNADTTNIPDTGDRIIFSIIGIIITVIGGITLILLRKNKVQKNK